MNRASSNRQQLPTMRENFPVRFWKAHGQRRSFDKPAVMDRSDLVTTFSSFSVICLQYWRSALRLRSSLHQPVSAKASPSRSADVAIGLMKSLGLRSLQPLAATRRRGWHSVPALGHRSEDPLLLPAVQVESCSRALRSNYDDPWPDAVRFFSFTLHLLTKR